MLNKEKKKKNRIPIVAFGTIVLVCILVFLGIGWSRSKAEVADTSRSDIEDGEEDVPIVSQARINAVEFEGNNYVFNRELTNFLFMGIDRRGEVELEDMPRKAGRVDALMILTIDHTKEEVRMMQIPRDTMVELDIINTAGDINGTFFGQLSYQYAYGSGGKSSAQAVRRTVGRLLNDLPIHGYIALNIDSVALFNNALGGVTLTIPSDYTGIDPAFVEGVELTLSGEQAERFVQYRDITIHASNQDRMERQNYFFTALFKTIKQRAGDTSDEYLALYELVKPFMVTDLQVEDFTGITGYDYDSLNALSLPGEFTQGEVYDEFYVDEATLKELLIRNFYTLDKS